MAARRKTLDDAEFVFLPLGGSNEIGMNLNDYGYGPPEARQWIIVDIGVTFGDATTPGIDIIMADPEFLEDEDVLAIVLTHAHEDHVGAIAHLWPRFRVPVYATPFTAVLAREKLREAGLDRLVKIHVEPLDGRFSIGPFDLQLITLTHSIPEPNGLAIRTPLGLVLHTGDWKIDPDPLIGAVTDETALRALADEGVIAMICDSTNVFVEGHAGSEADVRAELIRVVAEQKGRVAVACFASNVARFESALLAAEAAGRSVCLVGRSMRRIYGAAKEVGLLKAAAPVISEQDAAHLAPENVMLLCTGSQGEPQAALSRIASGNHPTMRLGLGDSVLFSSRVIPGNEQKIFDLQNRLVECGVQVITDHDRPIHVSGHPCREELRLMYQWVRPRVAIPTHGERRHILEHAALARSLQISETLTPRNGDMIRLAPGPAAVIDETPAGRLFLDGSVLTPEGSESLRERAKLAFAGIIHLSLAVSESGKLLSGPELRVSGLSASTAAHQHSALERIEDAAENSFLKLDRGQKDDDEAIENALRRTVRREAEAVWGKKPLVEISVLRV